MNPVAAPDTPISVLLVDDDPDIRELVSAYLREHGVDAVAAGDGTAMYRALKQRHFDLILLDIMLPGDDGLTLCAQVRERAPVILLTALAEESDRVLGLELGADDYLTKPFSNRELLARIRAVLRRGGPHLSVHRSDPGEGYRFEGWTLSLRKRELRAADGTLVSLTGGEFDLLLAFARHPGRVLDRDELLELTKGRRAQAFDRAVDVQLSRLRKKLGSSDWIRTVRGGGYLFAVAVSHE